MHINLTTPMSDDKERQQRNETVLDAIEQYTEERMNDENTDGSRSGGQPVIKTQHCPNCESQATEIEALRHDLERQMTIANEHVNEVERLREALEAAPIINLWESKEDFRRRQDGWLKTKYRAALEQSK